VNIVYLLKDEAWRWLKIALLRGMHYDEIGYNSLTAYREKRMT
jgi:hypothetical protein